MIRLFVMVLETHKEYNDDIKVRENFSVKFRRSNGFQNFIDADVWGSRLETFSKMIDNTISKEKPDAPLSKKFALKYGLRLNDDEYTKNAEWLAREKAEAAGEAPAEGKDEAGGEDAGAPPLG
jgi:hypothetical protein